MITLLLLSLVLGAVLILISGIGVILLDPIIAILIVVGAYKLIKCIFGKK